MGPGQDLKPLTTFGVQNNRGSIGARHLGILAEEWRLVGLPVCRKCPDLPSPTGTARPFVKWSFSSHFDCCLGVPVLLDPFLEGPNPAATRTNEMSQIATRAMADHIYLAGVEAAPHYKWRVLRQGIYREGIPAQAVVLRDWDD